MRNHPLQKRQPSKFCWLMDPATQAIKGRIKGNEHLAFSQKNLAVVIDGMGYFAALKASADFGCVCHVPKEEKND